LKLLRFILKRKYHELLVFKLNSSEYKFRSIWRNNYWGNEESLSGPGSTLEQAENLISSFPEIIEKFEVGAIFDAPCGDFNWMKEVKKQNPNLIYKGGDLVPEIITFVKSKYSSKNTTFSVFDITRDRFPTADLWLSRAIFYHLSYSDIYRSLVNFAESNISYILTTNCVTEADHKNRDIKSGDWRLLNLHLYPFNFPHDFLWEIKDSKYPHPEMKLTLWRRNQIVDLLPQIKANIST
jgi:hypothetical protein